MKGQVYKVHTDSYSVKYNEKLNKCGARGILKRKGDGILVGDFVDVEKDTIISVQKRKNRFIRPNVSNIDLIVGVVTSQPKPDFYLIDKLYLNAIKEDVEFMLVVNKADISDDLIEKIEDEYATLGIEVLSVSTKTGQGIEILKGKLKNKITVLAGQSAVGKTSIVNAMFGLQLKVGELSDKILRGKHTTTRSEIFECEDIKVVDSPGFAVIDAMVSLDELPSCYPEYVQVQDQCKFRGCTHVNEPNCKVKELVELDKLSKKRYQRYVEIYNEISKRRIIYEKD